MMPYGVFQRSLIRDVVPLFCTPPPSFDYITSRLRNAQRLGIALPAPEYCIGQTISSHLLFAAATMMDKRWSAESCELWVASLATELIKCRPSLAGVAGPPRVRLWVFVNGHLLSSEKWVGEDFGHNLYFSQYPTPSIIIAAISG
jgi:hypothetical protein